MESQVTEAITEAATDPALQKSFDLKVFLSYEVGGFTIGNILAALVVLIIGLLVKKILDRLIDKILNKAGTNAKVSKLIQKVADVLIVFIIIMITASTLGINTGSIIALAAVFSLGIVLALNDILSNLAGGIEIIASKIFRIDDFIEVGGVSGSVIVMNLTHTRIKTPDNQIISVPNKEISSKTVINYNTNPTRRNPIAVTASYDSPTELVVKALIESAAEEPAVLKDPAPFVYITDYKESAIEYTLYFWTPSNDWWQPKMRINTRIREKFAKYGVEMTYGHVNVHMVE